MNSCGGHCPSCGECGTGVDVDHGPDFAANGYPVRRHTVCPNCDRGLCSEAC